VGSQYLLTAILQQVAKIDAALSRVLFPLVEYFDYPAILNALGKRQRG